MFFYQWPLCALSTHRAGARGLRARACNGWQIPNVHPNKLEVRFKSAYDVRRTMEALLYRAFQGETMLSLEEETADGGAEAASNANQTEVYKNSTPVCIETSAPSASTNKTDLKQTIDYIRRTPVFSGQPMTLREMREAFFAPKAPAQAQ